ncbi:MAG: hypothetical protein V1648_02110 [Candidatus Aenigmatarchaeota archaeon]
MDYIVTLNDVLKIYKSQKAGEMALKPYKKWFPLKPSPELAGVVADLICDGHLQGSPKWRIDFTFKINEEKLRFERKIEKIFGVKGKARPCYSNVWGESYNYGVNCKPLAKTLFMCGVPSGNKVLGNFAFPAWILEDKNYFREFTKRFYNCEGTCWGGKSPGIGFEMWKEAGKIDNLKEFLEVIRCGLKKFFDIKTTEIFTTSSMHARKDGYVTKPLRFYIKRKESIFKFYKDIGFEYEKQNKLKNIIEKWGRTSVGTEVP